MNNIISNLLIYLELQIAVAHAEDEPKKVEAYTDVYSKLVNSVKGIVTDERPN